jgi:hypothetical protein
MKRQCYAALVIDGVEATERVPVCLTLDGGGWIDRELNFKVPRNGSGVITFFDAPTGPAWSFRWGDDKLNQLLINQTVDLHPGV